MERSEKSIETSINRKVKAAGGISIKMQHTGLNGFPDRQYIIPIKNSMDITMGIITYKSKTVFVEFKKYGEEPTRLQEVWGRRLLRTGCNYFLINSKDSYERFCRIYSL